MGEVTSRFYLRLDVTDRPGVSGRDRQRYSATLESASARSPRKRPPVMLSSCDLTHEVAESALQRAVSGIGKLDVVAGVRSLIRTLPAS